MNFCRKYILFPALLFSLPISVVQASGGTVESSSGLVAPINYAAIFPSLAEGFDALIQAGFQIPTFQLFIEYRLAESNGVAQLGFQQAVSIAITQAQDVIFNNMRHHFLEILGWAVQHHIVNLDQIADPIFSYVMKYRDGFMADVVKTWVNYTNNFGDHFCQSLTPLQWAARSNSDVVVRFLIETGAHVNARFNGTETALYYACMNNSTVIPLMLLSAGACVNVGNNDFPPVHFSPLHAAVMINSIIVTQLLIARGAQVNWRNTETGQAPLHYDAINNSVEIAQLLIAAGADVNRQDYHGDTPLHFAAINNSAAVAQLLINHHADVNILNYQACSPLHVAVESGATPVVRLLVDAHANLDDQENTYGYTPLHYAAENDLADIVEILLNAGADMTIRSDHGFFAQDNADDPEVDLLFQREKIARAMRGPQRISTGSVGA